MSQLFEYPMWTPHEKAKLYRKYTGTVPVELKDRETIVIEDIRYALGGSFRWIESTANESGDNQAINGLIIDSSYLTIRTNSHIKFKKGDVLMLPDSCRWAGLWIITDGVRSDFAYVPNPVQTYQYLPMEKML